MVTIVCFRFTVCSVDYEGKFIVVDLLFLKCAHLSWRRLSGTNPRVA
jgi:hypothetical protein